MLSRKYRIEELKIKKEKKDALNLLGLNDVLDEASFVSLEDSKKLLEVAYEMAYKKEINRFNFLGVIKNSCDKNTYRDISKDDILAIVDGFIDNVYADSLTVLFLHGRLYGLNVDLKYFKYLKLSIKYIYDDIVIISKNTDHGICILYEEHFTRYSQW